MFEDHHPGGGKRSRLIPDPWALTPASHHTRHEGVCTIGWPALQPKASRNSVILPTTLFTRSSGTEGGLVSTWGRPASGRIWVHHTLPNARKKRCWFVSPCSSLSAMVLPCCFRSSVSAES